MKPRIVNKLLSVIASAVLVLLAGCGGSSDSHNTDAISGALLTIRTSLAGAPGAEIPGAVADVMSGSAHTTVASGGTAPDSGEDLYEDARFHIGSITKTFTAALIMQLDQEGKLSIDDPLSRYIAFPLGDQITLRQLLAHTSGIASFTVRSDFFDYFERNPYATPHDVLNLMRRFPKQTFAPGQGWEYSNSNYYLLGLVAEQVTGRQWGDEVRKRFIEPYGLSTAYVYGAANRTEAVPGYTLCLESNCPPSQMIPFGSDADYRLGWAAGSLVASTQDVSRWMQLLVAGPVLDEEHRQEMQTVTPQSEASLKAAGGHANPLMKGAGLCLFSFYAPGTGYGWGHEGEIGGHSNISAYFADADLAITLATNTITANVLEGLRILAEAVEEGES